MRNLKKTLCLVLALVFVLGLCTVGVGAVNGTEFSDQEEINYATAVKAMSGLGILVGDDNDGDGKNEFRPADGVTRAQAAKIIAYLVVGAAAEQWPARAEFDDVPADHWAAKYVTYCKYNNIIAGYGNGKFGPDDPVTMVQFARMLLSACGFGLKDEFIGASWDQNVAKRAMTCKLTKGLAASDVDWDKPATREAAAQMAYTTLMEVDQVVLNSTTNDYTAKSLAAGGGTFGDATWELDSDSGIVIDNKTTLTEGKGLYLDNGKWYQTDVDEDPDILGHYVTIKFREEGAAPNIVNVAYYVDDECTEVKGAAANNADLATGFVQFSYGEYNTAVPASAAMSAKGSRDNDKGTYVLNADKKIVAYKYANCFLAQLKVDKGKTYVDEPSATAPYTGRTNVPVIAPSGAKAGDVLTVYKMGEVYTGVACTKEEKVQITQGSKDFYGKWTYNNAAVSYTKADNAGTTFGTVTGFDGSSLLSGDGPLTVGYSYTLYFDAEKRCYGYSNAISGAADSIPYVTVVAVYNPTDSYGDNTKNYAQVVNAEGKIENLLINNTDVAAWTAAIGTLTGVSTNAFTGISSLVAIDTSKAASVVGYNPTEPTMDYSNATFLSYNGTLSDLKVFTIFKPRTANPSTSTPAANINYTYTSELVGNVYIRHVKTVWFAYADTAPAIATKDSYIYLVRSDVKEYKLTNDVKVPYFNGYLNGTAMNDLRLPGDPDVGPAVGFYTYTVANGTYTLTSVPAGDGVTPNSAGARDIALYSGSASYILEGKLYAGNSSPIDLSNVKVVKVGLTAFSTVDVSNADAMLAAQLNGKTIKITFVENIDLYGVHTVGGGVLYVYAIE